MKLYGRKISGNCHKVRLVLSFLKLPYLDKPVQLLEQKESWFLELNPFGQVPVWVDEKITLSDSLAIALYLCERFDVKGCSVSDLMRHI